MHNEANQRNYIVTLCTRSIVDRKQPPTNIKYIYINVHMYNYQQRQTSATVQIRLDTSVLCRKCWAQCLPNRLEDTADFTRIRIRFEQVFGKLF